jgi:SAM-dependent methyltransferase
LSTFVRLFRLGLSVGEADAARAFGSLLLERAEAMGLVRTTPRGIEAPVALLPFEDLILAADHDRDRSTRPRNHVLGVTGPSVFLADLTPRKRVASVLDLGTGCGVQAFLAARHADQAVGLDVNPRALAFAAFNAMLNGVENVGWQERDLLATDVADSDHDLVISNPPYVISPENRFAFRDGGLAGDAFCERLVRRVPSQLREGGLAVLLIAWGHREDWASPVRAWVEGAGCDAILLHYVSHDPLSYAAGWNRPLRMGPRAYGEALDRWCEYYRGLGFDALALGAIVLRRSAGPHWFWAHSLEGRDVRRAGQHVLRLVQAQDLLAHRRESFLDEAFTLPDDHRFEQTIAFEADEPVVQRVVLTTSIGAAFRARLDAAVAELVSRLDGRHPLREAVAETASAVGVAPSDSFVKAAVEAVTRLLELGLVVPARS